MSDWIIETVGLTKTYTSGWRRKNRVEAVADLDLQVGRGEIFAFLGPNGAGKTTTINVLMGFLQPTRGHVALLVRRRATTACARQSVICRSITRSIRF